MVAGIGVRGNARHHPRADGLRHSGAAQPGLVTVSQEPSAHGHCPVRLLPSTPNLPSRSDLCLAAVSLLPDLSGRNTVETAVELGELLGARQAQERSP